MERRETHESLSTDEKGVPPPHLAKRGNMLYKKENRRGGSKTPQAIFTTVA